MPASTMSVILCAAALAARPTLAEILFYAGGACIALGIGAAADFDPCRHPTSEYNEKGRLTASLFL